MRTLQNVKLFGYVIMPDHLHLVLLPSDGTQLTTLIRSFKIVTTKRIMTDPSFIASIETIRNIDTHGHFRVWQHRGFDHNCRGTESVLAKIEYCHRNPVRAGLVEQSTEYPWSSARWYAGIRDQMLVIDDMYQELR
jgi:putative transposase